MRTKYIVGGWIWFILLSGYCYALDRTIEHPSIYKDSWVGEYKNIIVDKTYTMMLDIGTEEISWNVNEKAVEIVDYEYIYSKLPMPKPFLCIYAQDGDDKHIFCGIIHEAVPFYKLIGLYEYSTPIDSQLGSQSKRRVFEVAVELIGRESESR